jgi:hypothetical protein
MIGVPLIVSRKKVENQQVAGAHSEFVEDWRKTMSKHFIS